MKTVILGAGGLGSYVGAVLCRAGHDVYLAARGEHRAAIERDGLRVHGADGDFVTRPGCIGSATEVEGVTAVIVTVKSFSLDEVAPQVRQLATAGAVVVPLLNGVDNTDRLREVGIPPEALVDGIAYFTAFRTGPGTIERKGEHQRLVIGSKEGSAITQLPKVVDLFAGTSVEVQISDDIRADLWSKMAVVCSLAAICGITDSPIGLIRRHPLGRDLQARAIDEVLRVGRAEGAAIPDEAAQRVGEILDAFPDDFYPSVLHDLRSARPTEMDSLGGVICRLGRTLGVQTPLSDAATCAVQLIERARLRVSPLPDLRQL